jgi:hypothetical protein
MTDVRDLIRQIDPGLAADMNRPRAAHSLVIMDELGSDLIMWGCTEGRG